MRLLRLVIAVSVLFTMIGCRATVSRTELDAILQGTQGNTFPGELIYEGRSNQYDHYRIDDPRGTYGRYRVRREAQD